MSDLPDWAFSHFIAISGFDPLTTGIREQVKDKFFPDGYFVHAWRYDQGVLHLFRYESGDAQAFSAAATQERNGLIRFLQGLFAPQKFSTDEEVKMLTAQVSSALPLDLWKIQEENQDTSVAQTQGEIRLLLFFPKSRSDNATRDLATRELERLRKALSALFNDQEETGYNWDIKVTADVHFVDQAKVDTLKEDVLDLQMEEESLAHRQCSNGEMWIGFAKLSQLLEHQNRMEALLGKGTSPMLSENIRTWLGDTPTNRSLERAFTQMAGKGSVEEFPFLHNGMTVAGLESVKSKGNGVLRISKPRILNGAQTLNAFGSWQGSSKQALDPVVLVKVIQDNSTDDFVRRVTAANNRQNPVESADIRAGDPIHKKIEARVQALGWQYHYRRSWLDRQSLKDIRAPLLSMREALPLTWHLVHGRFNEARRIDLLFDDESSYGECFGWFLASSEKDSLRRLRSTAVFWSAYRRLKQMKLVNAEGEWVHPVGEIRSKDLTPVSLRDLYHKQVKHLASVLLIRRWMQDQGMEDLWECRQKSWAGFETRMREELSKLARRAEFKEVFGSLLVLDRKFRKEQEIQADNGTEIRISWTGLATNQGFNTADKLLMQRDSAWKWREW
ncbi:MAG TPA: AIPR family protein [Fibrobacteraceae bacterium]|nr:AIPR family protein [Fibrobacteraceae bacterium]